MHFDNPVELLTAFLCALLALFFLTRSLPRLSTGFTDRFQPLAPPLLAYLQRPGLLASVGMLLFFAYVAGFSELIGSWLVVLGLLTPFGALALTSTMAMAALQHILTAGLTMYVLELVVLYLGGSLAILLVGPGRFSFDAGLVSALVTPQNRDAATSAVPVSNA